jgi:hypothetical protein
METKTSQVITIKTAWINLIKFRPISLKNSGTMEERHQNSMTEKYLTELKTNSIDKVSILPKKAKGP